MLHHPSWNRWLFIVQGLFGAGLEGQEQVLFRSKKIVLCSPYKELRKSVVGVGRLQRGEGMP